jgi:ribosomal protein S18 acetylase RimI-like enzyme
VREHRQGARRLGALTLDVVREDDPRRRRRLIEELTAGLGQWFGRPESNRHYAQRAEALEGWVARRGGRDLGLLLVKRHAPTSAEIYWLGVDPDHHRGGIGRALVERVEGKLREHGVKHLFVMTLHPDDPYEPYQRTRRFYESMGFTFVLSADHGADAPPDDRLAYYLKLL